MHKQNLKTNKMEISAINLEGNFKSLGDVMQAKGLVKKLLATPPLMPEAERRCITVRISTYKGEYSATVRDMYDEDEIIKSEEKTYTPAELKKLR